MSTFDSSLVNATHGQQTLYILILASSILAKQHPLCGVAHFNLASHILSGSSFVLLSYHVFLFEETKVPSTLLKITGF